MSEATVVDARLDKLEMENPYRFRFGRAAAALVASLLAAAAPVMAQQGARARDLGVPFDGSPGPLNAITDVSGVRVAHTTLIRGEGELRVGEGPVRTGVTVIFPRWDHPSDPYSADGSRSTATER